MKQKGRVNSEETTRPSDDLSQFIAGLRITDIHFSEASFRFSPELRALEQLPPVYLTVEARLNALGPDAFEAAQFFTLKGRMKPKSRLLVNVKCELVASYETSVQVTPDLFNVFKHSTLILNTWPYLREFVQSCTLRAGLPPLVLPLAKFISPPKSHS